MQIYESRLPVQIVPFAHPTQREGNIVAASWKKVDENTSTFYFHHFTSATKLTERYDMRHQDEEDERVL